MEAALVRQVWQRARRCCEYCRMPQDCDPIPFEIDHIIPRKHGGPTLARNLAVTCNASTLGPGCPDSPAVPVGRRAIFGLVGSNDGTQPGSTTHEGSPNPRLYRARLLAARIGRRVGPTRVPPRRPEFRVKPASSYSRRARPIIESTSTTPDTFDFRLTGFPAMQVVVLNKDLLRHYFDQYFERLADSRWTRNRAVGGPR
jgi:hypothetical protein